MQNLGKRDAAHKAAVVGAITATLLLTVAPGASAQSASSAAPSEAAQRAAASPYRFILQSSTAPRKPAPAPAAAAAPAAAEPKKSAPPAVQQAAAQPSATQQPSRPTSEAAPAPAASAPEPAVAALSRQPAAEPPPVRREIIPVRTDEPRLTAALLREQPHGTVKIQFDINYDGSVGEVKVMSSSNRALNKPTIEAVQGWKFQPVDEVLTVQTEIVYNLDKQ